MVETLKSAKAKANPTVPQATSQTTCLGNLLPNSPLNSAPSRGSRRIRPRM